MFRDTLKSLAPHAPPKKFARASPASIVDLAKGFDQGSAEIQNLIGSDHHDPSPLHRVTFANFPGQTIAGLADADDNRALVCYGTRVFFYRHCILIIDY